jgi:hypothetical protein
MPNVDKARRHSSRDTQRKIIQRFGLSTARNGRTGNPFDTRAV